MTQRLSPLHVVQKRANLTHKDQAGWLIAVAENDAAAVTVSDCSQDSNLQIEGTHAADFVRNVFGSVPQRTGAVISKDGIDIGQLAATRYILRGGAGADRDLAERLQIAAGSRHITITNQTDGIGGLHIVGERAAVVMSMLCGLDFAVTAFPIGSMRVSSFAKVRSTIWHTPSGYRIYAGRSYLEYLATVTQEAATLAT